MIPGYILQTSVNVCKLRIIYNEMSEKQDRGRKKQRGKGSGSIWKNGGKFYFRLQIGGRSKCTMLRNPDDSPCTTETQAAAAAKLIQPILMASTREEIATHVAIAKKIRKRSGLRLSDAWEVYQKQPNRPDLSPKSAAARHAEFRMFLDWLRDQRPGVTMVSEIDADIAEAYFADVWSRGISARTYNIYLSGLRVIFKHLAKPGGLDENPFLTVIKKTEEIASRREFEKSQVDAIFSGFSSGFFYIAKLNVLGLGRSRKTVEKTIEFKPMHAEQMRVLLNLCCWAACDGQCGCLMTWSNIDFDRNRISYVRHKTRRASGGLVITLPLHTQLRAALIDAVQWRTTNRPGEDFILPAVAARYRTNPSGIQKDVMKIIRCATGLSTTAATAPGRRKLAANQYSLHSFRHTFVSFCANAGVPGAVVTEIVGHGSQAVTRHYTHISEKAKIEAIAALPSAAPLTAGIMELRTKLTQLVNEADETMLKRLLEFFGGGNDQ